MAEEAVPAQPIPAQPPPVEDAQKLGEEGLPPPPMVDAAGQPLLDDEYPTVFAQVCPIILDSVVLAIFVATLFVLPKFISGTARRGFLCSDPGIYMPDLPSTVKFEIILVSMLGGALLVMIIVEWMHKMVENKELYDSILLQEGDFFNLIFDLFKYFGCCMLGLFLNLTLCYAAKFMVGRLRPNFIVACQPNISLVNCFESGELIVNYKCTTTNNEGLEELHRSFFSSNASVSMHFAVYLAVYMQGRMPRRLFGYTPRPVLQCTFVVVSLFIGYSRITDCKNFESDVFTGFVVGAITAVIAAVVIADVLAKPPMADAGVLAPGTMQAPEDVAADAGQPAAEATEPEATEPELPPPPPAVTYIAETEVSTVMTYNEDDKKE